jgi:hypothetical protein
MRLAIPDQVGPALNPATLAFKATRDQLLACRGDLAAARRVRWPDVTHTGSFNWATDWFDVIARDNHTVALRVRPTLPPLHRCGGMAGAARRIGGRPATAGHGQSP